MGREGDANEVGGTQRLMGVTVVVMVATLVLLSAPASTALDSHHYICPITKNSIKVYLYDVGFIGTNSNAVALSVKAAGCINDTRVLSLWQYKVSNKTSWRNLKWYEFVNCGNYLAKIGSETVKFKHEVSTLLPTCSIGPVTLNVGPRAMLGSKCHTISNLKEVQQRKDACKALGGVSDTARRPFMDKLDSWRKKTYDILHATSKPTYNGNEINYFDNDLSNRGNYTENAIPIFIGIVLLTVSMCLRFCLCRGKSVVRRVTTVTVIRERPIGADTPQDQQDPPPSYVDVVNEATSPQSTANEGCVEPSPPAYADIVDEVMPPTYSEVEAQSMPTSEEAPLEDQETEVQTTQPPSDPESGPDAKGLAPSKSMLSKYRSQQKQFAFKVLEEDE